MTRPPVVAQHSLVARGIRLAQVGLVVNAVLTVVKLLAGILGNSYALIADAIESLADIFSSFVVWSGLSIASRSADDSYPFGYGRAESLASAIVGLMLIAAAFGISIEAVREIITPHHAPAPFTLLVLVVIVILKERLFRKVIRAASEVGSNAVAADAWHHRSDAITSSAAFVGISVALIGGKGWESADDYAALLAAVIVVVNGVRILRPAVAELMDRAPDEALIGRVGTSATTVEGVRAIEKLKVRKLGARYRVDLHVQADPAMSLHDAHILSGRVKSAIRRTVPAVEDVLVHMEPFEGS